MKKEEEEKKKDGDIYQPINADSKERSDSIEKSDSHHKINKRHYRDSNSNYWNVNIKNFISNIWVRVIKYYKIDLS